MTNDETFTETREFMSRFCASFPDEFQRKLDTEFRKTRLYKVTPISMNLNLSHVGTHMLQMPRSFYP